MHGCADKRVVVTGGSRGIGAGVAAALVAGDARVAVLARNVTGVPDPQIGVTVDVSDADSLHHGFELAESQLGGLDLLVCSAGVVSEHGIEDLDPAEWKRVLDTSLTGTYLACRAAVPRLRAAGGGAIVAMSSGWARRGYPRGSHYAAAKGGIEAFMRSLAVELAPDIRVNAVAPGPVRTDMLDDMDAFDEQARANSIPLGRIGEVEDVVAATLFLLSDAASHVTGQTLQVSGGLTMT